MFAHVSPLCTRTHQIKSMGVNHLPSYSQVIVSKAFAELQESIKQSPTLTTLAKRADTQMSPRKVPGYVHCQMMSSLQVSFTVGGDTALCVRCHMCPRGRICALFSSENFPASGYRLCGIVIAEV